MLFKKKPPIGKPTTKMQDMFDGDGDEPVVPKAPKKIVKIKGPLPGSAATAKRPPLQRGEPFQPKSSLVNWSTR